MQETGKCSAAPLIWVIPLALYLAVSGALFLIGLLGVMTRRNPLLLLLIYTFVFTAVLPGIHPREMEPYALFMFCGILPWTWFSSSVLESSGILMSSGNLIKKILFPAEVLPIVVVLFDQRGGAVRAEEGHEDIGGSVSLHRVPRRL